MVRVVADQYQQSLNAEQKKLLLMIGVSIEKHPQSYIGLLKKYNAIANGVAATEEIKDKVISMLSKKNTRFNQELSQLLGKQLSMQSTYDNFSMDDITGVIDKVSSVIGSFGSGTPQKEVARQEMKKGTYEKMLELKSQSEKNKLEQSKLDQKAGSSKNVWVVVGVSFSVLLLGIGAAIYFTREKPLVTQV